MSKQKKNCFKLGLKHQIVQRIEDNISLDLILEEFRSYGVTMDNIDSFKKRKDKIKHDFESCLSSRAKSSKPQNTTSRLQPMDAVVIHSLKASYRQRFVKSLLAIFDEKKFLN